MPPTWNKSENKLLRNVWRHGQRRAVTWAEKVRSAVEAHRFAFDGVVIPVTISLGVAELGAEMKSPQQLIKAADDKLYESKRSGRNRVSS